MDPPMGTCDTDGSGKNSQGSQLPEQQSSHRAGKQPEQDNSRNKPTARTRQHSEQENAKAAAA
jgi:hypothetical protein